ncbi:TetR/AcrR family transcriptional regulator [Hoyosella rhizosphaerae]|uniref:Transcriptional regulator, TetR family protein n=1 Tax=Hoyosella rhizosphaerae TaxID=1755582 RepID=A0A916UAG8_9ACTN|nr:TetR/AcrR family transcriptional regulator [Hoyosella rhizosphaerae]MBN4926121.1 TetR/AcrR family transcriptional regulator [Hoyosella rhizosphaerae]GGC65407.1 putative transcriptional regulator, TetR family protein [Hoyosella rhizosphaerae]
MSKTTPQRHPPTDKRALRWERHKTARRLHILDAAVTAIEKEGPAVGVSRIADEAQLTRAVIYRFFRDRADLDYKIRAHIADKVLSDLAPTLNPEETPIVLIRRGIRTYLDWTTQHPHLHQFVGSRSSRDGSAGPDVATGAKTSIALQITALFNTVLTAVGKETDSAEPLAFALVGLVDATVNRWRRTNSPSKESLESLLCGWTLQLITSNMEALGLSLDPEIPLRDSISAHQHARTGT